MIYLKFLRSLLIHKWFVFVECVRLGIPWLGIVHDWSKFLPSEFIPYARHFFGKYPRRDQIRGDMRNVVPDRYTAEGVKATFDVAWLHHQKRNRHHWQYWLLQYDDEDRYFIQQHSEDSPMILALGRQQLLEVSAPLWEGDDAIHTLAYHRLSDVRDELNRKPVALQMPLRYRREMLADWRGAGRAYGNPDTAAWYLEHRGEIILHPGTRAWVEAEMGI